MEGNLRFKIDWASLIVGSKFTVFALFYFVFGGNFPSTSPRGAYIWRGDLTEGFFFRYRVLGGLYLEGLISGGAYFRNFTVFDQVTVFQISTLTGHSGIVESGILGFGIRDGAQGIQNPASDTIRNPNSTDKES